MDKIKFLTITIFYALLLASCCDSYKVDENFLFDETFSSITSVNGCIENENGFLLYGNVDLNIHYEKYVSKGIYFGLFKLYNDGSLDSNFQNPFIIPTSVYQLLEIRNGNYLIIYKHPKELINKDKILNIAIMNTNGNLKEINFDFNKLFLKDSINPEYIYINSIAQDSLNNIYLSLAHFSSNSVFPLIKLDSNFNLDDKFLNEISSSFIKGNIFSIQVQPDNKLLIGGNFILKYKLKEYKYFCRINPNGIVDSLFYNNLPEFDQNDYNRINCISQFDTTIYIGGNFSFLINKKKCSDLIRINNNGTLNVSQPNQHNYFNYLDDEPYFNKSTILSINEVKDSLLVVSGIFNHFKKRRINLPISIIRKDGNQIDYNFYHEYEIFMINSVYFKTIDTIYAFGNSFINKNNKLPLARLIKN